MAGDWIKLHRKLLDSDVFQPGNEELLRLFLWCLLRASWGDCRKRGRPLSRGQLLTTRADMADWLGGQPTTWYRRLRKLAEWGMVSLESNNKLTTITICNYETYQGISDACEQQNDSKVTAESQQSDSKPILSDKEIKKDKNKKNPPNPPPDGGKREKKPRTRTKRDDLFDAIVEVTGSDPSVNGKQIGGVVTTLLEADPPYTPHEVHQLPGVLSELGWRISVTIGTVGKYIGYVRNRPAKTQPNQKGQGNLFQGIDAFLENDHDET